MAWFLVAVTLVAVVASTMAVSLCITCGRITESERRVYYREHGEWPDW